MRDIDSSRSRSTRQLRSFLFAVVAGLALVVTAPIIFHSGFGFPLFSLKSWLSAGAVTFAVIVPGFWAAFSRRSDVITCMAVVALSIIVIVSVFIAWRYH
jgi:hypothetical protein